VTHTAALTLSIYALSPPFDKTANECVRSNCIPAMFWFDPIGNAIATYLLAPGSITALLVAALDLYASSVSSASIAWRIAAGRRIWLAWRHISRMADAGEMDAARSAGQMTAA
jgi:hypothetical protein